MNEMEFKNLQIYVGKRSLNQSDDQAIEYIKKINCNEPLSQEEWNKLLFPCCNNGHIVVLKYVLKNIETIQDIKGLMEHTVYGRNEHLDEKRVDILKMFIPYIEGDIKEVLSDIMLSAAWFGETRIVEFLIENGADINYTMSNGTDINTCAERAELQFDDSSLKEYLAQIKNADIINI